MSCNLFQLDTRDCKPDNHLVLLLQMVCSPSSVICSHSSLWRSLPVKLSLVFLPHGAEKQTIVEKCTTYGRESPVKYGLPLNSVYCINILFDVRRTMFICVCMNVCVSVWACDCVSVCGGRGEQSGHPIYRVLATNLKMNAVVHPELDIVKIELLDRSLLGQEVRILSTKK